MFKVIAIDFDGCLCTNAYPEVGEPNWAVIEKAKAEKAEGAGLVLWTCRCGETLTAAINACQEWGLEFDAINESHPEWAKQWDSDPRKIGATEYWDDRAVRMPGPWISVNDKLPKPFQPVLCCRDINVVESGCFMPDGRWRIYGTYVKCVTHWMPMPEPPEEGERWTD